MKIRTTSDWREDLPFDVPLLASEIVPGEATRCAGCGADAAPHERTELWAVKHRHPNNPAGFVRFYCAAHRPQPSTVAAPVTRRETARRERAAAPARRPAAPTIPERPAVLCPDCFIEVAASGVCGMCGQKVA